MVDFWLAFATCLLLATALLGGSLLPGQVLSPADVLLSDAVFGRTGYQDFEPANRLLTDVAYAFEPWLIEGRRQLLRGQWPFLNPYSGLHTPLFGNFQSALLCPFNWPFLLSGSPRSFVLAAYLKLFAAGLGAWYLARSLRLRTPYAILAGAWYMLAGFVVLWLLYPLASVAVFFPWLTALAVRVARGPSGRSVAGLALATGLAWLGGHPETAVHAIAGAVLFTLGCGAWPRRREHRRLRTILALSAGFGLGSLVAMPAFSAFADYFFESQALAERSEGGRWRSPRTGLQVGLASAVTAIAPYAYGSYARGDVHVERALGVENFNETGGGYTSVVGVVLFLVGILVWPARRWMRAALLLSVAGWLIGYKIYPFYDLVQSLPIMGMFQNQRLLLWSCLFVPLAGAGLLQARAWCRLPIWRRWLPLAPLIAAATGSIAIACILPNLRDEIAERVRAHTEMLVRDGRIEPQVASARASLITDRIVTRLPQHYARTAFWCALVAAAYAAAQRRRVRRLACFALAAAALADLVLFARPQLPVIPQNHWFPNLTVGSGSQREAPPETRTLFVGEVFPPNAPTVYGVPDLRSYDGIDHRGLVRLVGALDPDARTTADALDGGPLARHSWRHRFLALIGVRYLAAAPGKFAASTTCWQPAGRIGALQRFRLTCERRAAVWYVPDTDRVQANRRLQALALRARPLDDAFVERGPDHELWVSCFVPEPGVLILPRLYLPGWRIADGPETAEVTSVGSALLGVRIREAGPLQVRLRYRPRFLSAAIACSSFAVITVLVLGIGLPGQRPRTRPKHLCSAKAA